MDDDVNRVEAAAMAWFGNAAKMRIIKRLVSDGQPKVIFDYGAGRGAGWAETLRLFPQLELIAYEPDPDSAQAFAAAVPSAKLLVGDAKGVSVSADVIVSFSVFEHVADRAAYLSHAYRALKPGGSFFLNYDDGHFRQPGLTFDNVRNRLAPVLPAIGLTRYYQATVAQADADSMVKDAGFEIVADRYENLEGMKRLARTVPLAARADFASLWLDLEARLDGQFRTETSESFHGDRTNLWRELASRTLELTRS
jgi:SAM-dependent methyltransferase